MSVNVSERNISKCQAVMNAIDLKEKIHELCIRDLGIKDPEHMVRKKYSYKGKVYKKEESLVFLLFDSKRTLHDYSDQLIANTRSADKIKMADIRSCNLRLDYQDRAINNCEMLIGKIQDIAAVFSIDINKLRRYIEAIDEEINSLQSWKRMTINIRDNL